MGNNFQPPNLLTIHILSTFFTSRKIPMVNSKSMCVLQYIFEHEVDLRSITFMLRKGHVLLHYN